MSVDTKGTYLFGGLDCETWIYDAGNKTLHAPPGESAQVRGSGTLRIEDFWITADAPALDPGTYAVGNSSISVLAEAGSLLDTARCDVVAGNGSDGAPGEPAADRRVRTGRNERGRWMR
ncbi:MAG: hypothetical protein R3F14_41080 [Polyangiaceae bacterium]